MKRYRCRGIVLGKTDFGDADIQLDIFTDTKGRNQFYIKGIRKTKKREIAAMDILSHSEFLLIEGDKAINLGEFTLITPFLGIKSDLYKIGIALYVIQVIKSIVQGNEKRESEFKLLIDTLNFIEKNNCHKKFLVITAYFLLRIIKIEGILFESVNMLLKVNNKKNISDLQLEILEKIVINRPQDIEYDSLSHGDVVEIISLLERYLNMSLDMKIDYKEIFELYLVQ